MEEQNVVEVSDSSFEGVVEKSRRPVLMMFYSPLCPHCMAMMPHFLGLAGEFSDRVDFVRINVLQNSFTVSRYGIISTPTFKFFCGGRPFQELVGEVPASILKLMVEEASKQGPSCLKKSTLINIDVAYV